MDRFKRVGSNREVQTNARILAATNRNLEERGEGRPISRGPVLPVERGGIEHSAVRERREDILPLASRSSRSSAKGNARFSPAVAGMPRAYPWPGNVRELRNAMERAALLSRGETDPARASARPGPRTAAEQTHTLPSDAERLEEIERQAILPALNKHDFNRTETAKALGISRRALIYKLQRFREMGLEVDGR